MGRIRTRLDLSRARGLSKFVGRGGEIESLQDALERARAGDGQVVGVMGEAGAGKSRLCFEFVERCRAEGDVVHEATASSHGQNEPFLPVLKLLRGVFGIDERDSDESTRDKITGRMLRQNESLVRTLPLVFDLLGVPDPQRPAPNLDPEVREQEILDVVRGMIHAPNERGGTVVLIEDLHWLDSASATFLTGLIDAVPGTRTLIVVNFRPEFSAEWFQRPYYQAISLKPLESEDLNELLVALLGSHPSLGGLPERILERSGGNPFFVEEAVRDLVESGKLLGEQGTYERVGNVGELDVPLNVQALIAARIDRLAEREKRILQFASVIGPVFRLRLLLELCDFPDVEIDAALSSLVSAEFIYEQALFPDPEYAFKHALTRDVAYDSQLTEQRQNIHANLAAAMVEEIAGSGGESAGLIAHHWERANRPLESARWNRRAAIWSGMGHQRQSLLHWLRVRELCDRLEETSETLALGIEARAQILTPIGVGDLPVDAEQLFAEAREMAKRSTNPGDETRVIGSYGAFRLRQGFPADAVEKLREAADVANQSDDKTLYGGLVPFLTVALGETGPLSEAITLVAAAENLYLKVPKAGIVELGVSPVAPGISFHGMWLGFCGDVDAGRRDIERARKVALDQEDWTSLAVIDTNAVHLEIEAGDPESARRVALKVEESGVMPHSVAPAAALAGVEKWREAEDAFSAHWEACSTQYQLTWWPMRALVNYELGSRLEALSMLEECAAQTQAGGARICELRTRWMLAHLLIRERGLDAMHEIETALDRADSLVEATDANLFRPRLLLERAAVARLRGDEKGRERALLEAAELFTKMGAAPPVGATGWPHQS